ncbi:hypothetical protein RchiOBHm_Chr1g0334731 [Rosa chinensis]|uniref:Uncharacterized protein n=1 Tax=Rosa chinensis TaxID=74649 RepID=A0A2P6SCD8_ROSCH|nr:uncharacterized protein LOC112193171 [Rosa chinensis]XP_040368251.1 uncharacterized protein LOC112193171 [Rosa chinensis]PRQ56342.1 hypothetical protein RchiOBHm_Chr1g0334731 [Rosa chinensis]
MAENTEIVSRDEGPKKPINLFALFPKFKLQFPFWKQQEQKPGVVPVEDEATNTGTQKPVTVRFPKAQPVVPTVAAEVEEPVTKTSNPIIVWQVYALGGFLVLKWIWARWQERKDKKEESSDDEQSSADE